MNTLFANNHTTPVLREYQSISVDRAITFFNDRKVKGGGLLILPTGSGKSIVIASIINSLSGKTIVLQPSREILEQNFDKLLGYGYHAGIYSASLGKKQVNKITFATIGSVINQKHLFEDFEHVIIDECHLVNPKGGMYAEFLSSLEKSKVLGLTATPYRLSTTSMGAMLKFLTRTRPAIFKQVVYAVQVNKLFGDGFLAKLRYFDIAGYDRAQLLRNSTGADFSEKSLRMYQEEISFNEKVLSIVRRLQDKGRRGILVFTALVAESEVLVRNIPGAAIVTGKTEPAERKRILQEFKAGIIKVVCNVGVLTTGFDYPELDTIVLARPTMSLALYYQMVGRAIRIHPDKEEAWIVDMCENMKLFGKVEDLKLRYNEGLWTVNTNGRQLTNVNF